MKFVIGFLIAMAAFAQAKELVCWDKYGKRGDSPIFRAHIVSNNELRDLVFKPRTDWASNALNMPSHVEFAKAQLITTNRSPYVGNNDFKVKGGRIILPTALNAKTLSQIVQTGIGKGGEKGVNGVIITSWKESDGGHHKSFRLVCRIYGEYTAY